MRSDAMNFQEDFSPVDVEASGWIAREEQGLSEPERARLQDWLVDPGHEHAYRRMRATWRVMGRMDELGSVAAPAAKPLTRSHFRRWGVGLAAAAAIAVAAAVGWQKYQRIRPVELTAVTQVGGWRVVALPDGTQIRLNTDSALDVHYTWSERRIRLARGEAHFTVAKNPQRPFCVEAGAVAVRAIGTAFNVRVRDDAIDVLVTEGVVKVDPSPAATPAPGVRGPLPLMTAGQKVSIPISPVAAGESAPVVTPVAPAEIDRALAWREERMKFDAVPLSTIVAEFNRYNRHQLVIEDAGLAAELFGGTFRPDHPENLVGMLEQTFGVVAEIRGDETVLRRRTR